MTPESRVAALLAEWSERRQRGEAADPLDVIRANPDLERELRAAFAALEALDLALASPPRGAGAVARIGRWRLLRELGSGGMGTVHLAADEAGSPVALKVVHPRLVEAPGYLRRFLREGELGMRVRHPNVVRTLEVGTDGAGAAQRHYLVMEHVEGRTLRRIAEEMGPLPERLCRHVGAAVARGLQAIHAAGAVHRDLKPENVIVTADETVKVMDLGVAHVDDGSVRLSRTGGFVGSVLYAAPEQIAGGEADARSDLYALGLTLYELATGVHPHPGDDVLTVIGSRARGVSRRAAELNPQLSPFFDELVHTLVETEPARRLASAEDAARALEEGESSAWWEERSRAVRDRLHGPLRRIRVPRETRLHGRSEESARLRAALDRAVGGEGRVVLLEGEAGIGKSRLVDEFVADAVSRGTELHTLYGSYPPGGSESGAGAFVAAYRDQLGDTGAERCLADLPRLVPAFQALLRGEHPPEGSQPLTRDSLHTVFVQVTKSLAAERPVVVFVDDLHFASDDGRALFLALAAAVADSRVLLVGAHRPGLPAGFVQAVERLPHAERTRLGRLSPKDLVALLRDAFRSEHLAQELGAKIAEKSDGNPFFVFEIVRGLKEGQFLRQKPDGTWVTDEIIGSIEVPSTVTDAVQTRLTDLAPEERDLLEVAACLGFEFDPVLAADVLGVGPIPALQTLGRVERRHGIVRSVGRLYAFDHHQIQEVLHAGLHAQLRERYHSAIAERLERDSGGAGAPATGERAVRLARHWLLGGAGAAAKRHVAAALDHLASLHRNEECLELAAAALALPGVLEGDARRSALVIQAQRCSVLGRRAEERAAIDAAVALPDGDASVQVLTLCQRAHVLGELGDSAGAWRDLEAARAVAERTGVPRDAIKLWSMSALQCITEGREEESIAYSERHRACGEAAGAAGEIARSYLNQGLAEFHLGRIDEGEAHTRFALGEAERTGDQLMVAAAAGNLGLILKERGRWDEARASHEKHLRVARELGNRRGEAHATGNLGTIDEAVGHAATAIDRFERDLALCRAMLDRYGSVIAGYHLACLLQDVGLLSEARRHAEEVVRGASELRRTTMQAWGVAVLAAIARDGGDAEEARARFDEATALARAPGAPVTSAASLLLRAAEAGDAPDRVRTFAGESLEIGRKLGMEHVLALAPLQLARVGDHPAAAAVAAFLEREQRLFHASRRAGFLLSWRLTGDRAHLRQATDLLVSLRAHAPPAARDTVLTGTRTNRAIAAGAAAEGIAPADWAAVLARTGHGF